MYTPGRSIYSVDNNYKKTIAEDGSAKKYPNKIVRDELAESIPAGHLPLRSLRTKYMAKPSPK